MAKRVPISAFVICCNEEQQIRRCLSSIAWCDEIVVIDSGSTDRTIEIARDFTPHIHHKPWEGFVEQKRFGLAKCTNRWVLNIDADEEVAPELQSEIVALLEKDYAAALPYDGYEISRVIFFLSRWWRRGGWYPEFRLRLMRRDTATWGGEDPHEKVSVRGSVGRLQGELRHFTYDDLADQVHSLNSHSSAAARSAYKRGVRASLVSVFSHAIARFTKFYVVRRGYREGTAGLIVGVLEAYYAFLKYAKIWELGRTPGDHSHLRDS